MGTLLLCKKPYMEVEMQFSVGAFFVAYVLQEFVLKEV